MAAAGQSFGAMNAEFLTILFLWGTGAKAAVGHANSQLSLCVASMRDVLLAAMVLSNRGSIFFQYGHEPYPSK